ncbi:MAG: teichuronic acid biosynthesis glycosyltransferase TuaH, partial [Glaciecola sp.]
MAEQRNIVITGIQPWDIEIGSNCKNIAQEFAKTHRVLYVNSPIDRVSAWKKRSWTTTKNRLKVINKELPALREVEKNLWVLDPSIYILPINWLPSFLF